MKVLIYTDPHFCEKFSIITKMGDKYTTRLENQIKSINWAEDLAYKKDANMLFVLVTFLINQI